MAQQPEGAAFGNSYAEITFNLGVEDMAGFGTATIQEYKVGPSRVQEDSRRVTMFTWANKDPQQLLVTAGQRVYVFAELSGLWGAPGITSWGSNSCLNISSFVPLPATRYQVVQHGEPTQGCSLQIVDAATGGPPAGLEVEQFRQEE